MQRREFLKNTTFAAFSVSAFGCVIPAEAAFTGDCETTKDILGPFYRPGAPIKKDLTYETQNGETIKIKGNVFGDDCTTPLKDCLVEIWHADNEGDYDNDSEQFRNRAGWMTEKDGSYDFKTILPGRYLNGSQFRPSHIHFRVKAAGHKELISQIYFKDDPYIKNDPWASDKRAELRILDFKTGESGLKEVTFDIFLAKLS